MGSIFALGAVLLLLPLLSIDNRENLQFLVDVLVSAAPGVILLSTIVATAAELGRLAFRAPTGTAWQAAASNRWLEAAAVGAAAAIVGVLFGTVGGGGWGAWVSALAGYIDWREWWPIACSMLGFVVAEAIVGWRIPHRAA